MKTRLCSVDIQRRVIEAPSDTFPRVQLSGDITYRFDLLPVEREAPADFIEHARSALSQLVAAVGCHIIEENETDLYRMMCLAAEEAGVQIVKTKNIRSNIGFKAEMALAKCLIALRRKGGKNDRTI